MGTPSFIRLVKAEGALRLPSADGDDLDFSAADWDPLSLECPDYNDPVHLNPLKTKNCTFTLPAGDKKTATEAMEKRREGRQ